MYKNQLQELAQRSCFNLPSYTSLREGPDHAPRFKALVNFNGECFESPSFCSTLRLAEHAAAEVALNVLSNRAPPHSLAARILDETGTYKNLLQEVSQRIGAPLPLYTTCRSISGYLPWFTCTVELAGITFTGEPARTKKQAEKNAAMAAWLSLKQLAQEASGFSSTNNNDEQVHVTVARALQNYLKKVKPNNSHFPIKFPASHSRPSSSHPSPITSSRILSSSYQTLPSLAPGCTQLRPHKFPAVAAVPYIPIRYHGIGFAPPVTIRHIVPAYSSLIHLPPSIHVHRPPSVNITRPVHVPQSVPIFAPNPVGSNASILTPPTLLNSPSQDPKQAELANSLKDLKL